MHRRSFLGSGLAAASAAVSWPITQRAAAVPFAPPEKPPRHFILLWMAGGLSHMDLWDIKEGSANQGNFKSIETAVPGIRIGEMLPNVAKEFKNLSIIRALCSKEGDPTRANYRMTHGHPPSTLGREIPSVGSVVGYHCGSASAPVPRCVTISGDSGFGDAGWLGPVFAGFPVANPGTVSESLRPAAGNQGNEDDRRHFLGILDSNFAQEQMPHLKKEADRKAVRDASQTWRELHDLAFEYSRRLDPKPFEFSNEDWAKIKTRFGDAGFGRGCLLAAKLVKAGSAAVSVTLGGWDVRGNFAASLPPLAGVLDRGFSGLMAELRETGLIHRTVVLCAGPYGRSPRISQNGARTPWPNGWSVVLGGCGIGGIEYGKTDKDGVAIVEKPVSVEQMYATLYTALGIDLNDPALNMHDSSGRKFFVAGERENARPIKELLGTAKG